MIELKAPETGDMYLDKYQEVAHELRNIIEHSLDDEKEQVFVKKGDTDEEMDGRVITK